MDGAGNLSSLFSQKALYLLCGVMLLMGLVVAVQIISMARDKSLSRQGLTRRLLLLAFAEGLVFLTVVAALFCFRI